MGPGRTQSESRILGPTRMKREPKITRKGPDKGNQQPREATESWLLSEELEPPGIQVGMGLHGSGGQVFICLKA